MFALRLSISYNRGQRVGKSIILPVEIGKFERLVRTHHRGNCLIGAGAKTIGSVRIGNNLKIGANCIVVEDMLNDKAVVLQKPKVPEGRGIDSLNGK